MRKQGLRGFKASALFIALLSVASLVTISAGTVMAVDSSSDNYQITEWQFGAGASGDSCSSEYCSETSIGDETAVGNTSSPEFGEVITDEPAIEVIVVPGESNLGTLSTERTATKTTEVKIRNNFDGGYVLQVVGEAPKYGNHVLNTPATPTASRMGTEQFAINLSLNTTPVVGLLPVQVQNIEGAEIVYGQPTESYRTPNMFMYQNGDTVAQSVTEKGRTDYTISMIVNIANTTPAGHYSGDLSLFVVPML